MDHSYWHKQTVDKPLYPDLLWSRPENRALAGKLVVVGGNAHGFSAAAEAYSSALKAGVGSVRVLLPDSLQATVGRVFETGEYAPSTPSGSFSQKALAEVLALANWGNGLLLAGDFGHNSETAILLESLLTKYSGQLTICGDALDYSVNKPQALLSRPSSLLVLDLTQLQKLATGAKFAKAFTSTMDFLKIIELLHDFTIDHNLNIVLKHLDNIFVAVAGQVSTTKVKPISMVNFATSCAVWWLQTPSKTFEALSTSVLGDD